MLWLMVKIFDKPITCNFKTYDNISKVAIAHGDDYTTGCLLDYSYFDNHYKIITVDLSRQQVFDADPRATQQINFIANLNTAGNTTMLLFIEEGKETVFEFSQGTLKVL